eukprot:6611157-Alexandrium_andersonii.AAC.1
MGNEGATDSRNPRGSAMAGGAVPGDPAAAPDPAPPQGAPAPAQGRGRGAQPSAAAPAAAPGQHAQDPRSLLVSE